MNLFVLMMALIAAVILLSMLRGRVGARVSQSPPSLRSPSLPNALDRLPDHLLVADLLPLLDVQTTVRVLNTDRRLRALIVEAARERVRRAIELVSGTEAASSDLPDALLQLWRLAPIVADAPARVVQALSTARLVRLYDRLVACRLGAPEAAQAALACAAALQPAAAPLFARLGLCEPDPQAAVGRFDQVGGALHWSDDAGLVDCLSGLRLPLPDGFAGHWRSEDELLAHMSGAGLVWDSPAVLALIAAGVRPHLIVALFHAGPPPLPAIGAGIGPTVLPLYRACWSGDVWAFLRDLLRLRAPTSRTSLRQFWSLGPIVVGPLLGERRAELIDGLRTVADLQLLVDVQYPSLGALLPGRRLLRRLASSGFPAEQALLEALLRPAAAQPAAAVFHSRYGEVVRALQDLVRGNAALRDEIQARNPALAAELGQPEPTAREGGFAESRCGRDDNLPVSVVASRRGAGPVRRAGVGQQPLLTR